MRTSLLVRVSRVLLSSIVLSLVALAACATTPEVTIILPASPTPIPTSFIASPTPLPSVSPSPTMPPQQPTPTPAAEFDIFKLSPHIDARTPTTFTMIFELSVINNEPIPAPETLFLIYDGDPKAGGELIIQAELPEVPAADPQNPVDHPGIVSKKVSWDVRGEGGNHQLFAYLCLADIRPSGKTCWIWDFPKEIPQLVWGVEVLGGAEVLLFDVVKVEHFFERGEQVLVRIYAANLDPAETFSFSMKSWVEFDLTSSPPVTHPLGEDKLQLPPGQMFERVYHYDTSLMPGPSGIVFLQLEGIEAQIPLWFGYDARTKRDGFSIPLEAYFIAEPLTGTAPLTVTFVNLTTRPDGHPVESWLWSFGDGVTSTAQLPTHTYTLPGTYTVALTATVYGQNLPGMRKLLSTVGNTPADLYTRYYTFTYTRSDYILVRP